MSSDWLSSRTSEKRFSKKKYFLVNVNLDYHQVRVNKSVDTVLQAVFSPAVNFIAWLPVKTSLNRRELSELTGGILSTHVPTLLVQTVDHILQREGDKRFIMDNTTKIRKYYRRKLVFDLSEDALLGRYYSLWLIFT